MEKVRPWFGQPSDRGRLNNGTEERHAKNQGQKVSRSKAGVETVGPTDTTYRFTPSPLVRPVNKYMQILTTAWYNNNNWLFKEQPKRQTAISQGLF